MVTQEKMAKILGITRTTVARALNGSENIRPETKEKVIALAKEMGYIKNYLGSSLALRSKKVVYAFVAKSRSQRYTDEINRGLKAAQKELKEYNFKIEIIETDINNPWEQLETLEKVLKTKDLDGVIITPLDEKRVLEVIAPYMDKVKVVSIGKKITDSIFYVEANYYRAGEISGGIMENILGENEKLLVIDGGDDNLSSKLYLDGFFTRVNTKNKNIIGPIYIENLSDNLEKISDYLTDDVKGFYCNRYPAEVIDYIQKEDRKLKIVTNGFNNKIKEFIKDEIITATVIEEIFEQGYIAGKHIFDLIYKSLQEKPHNYVVKIRIVFKENIDNF
ncbi:LacI family DNA-binding transcriptional regulator [Cetobacterium sp. 2A]|uniref:LacI family DNA-binding transcriptional regulator n=1 Tax=unclassified Cetobacterium TaxID=2630983 RepID=UPI00163D3B34|nr:LacI family DNA-binding transcriptional regulator [Cetobacterium sp. 2A]MBC2855559.1 LacI family DNA-binding transcriptional regulator [Cetobacterium sp. 2A]